jgi:integrase
MSEGLLAGWRRPSLAPAPTPPPSQYALRLSLELCDTKHKNHYRLSLSCDTMSDPQRNPSVRFLTQLRTLPHLQLRQRKANLAMTDTSPATVNRTLRRLPNSAYRVREYLTEKEVDRLIEAARKRGRNGARDAAAILSAWITSPRALLAAVGSGRSQEWQAACEQG